jgi:hypothetical protein
MSFCAIELDMTFERRLFRDAAVCLPRVQLDRVHVIPIVIILEILASFVEVIVHCHRHAADRRKHLREKSEEENSLLSEGN